MPLPRKCFESLSIVLVLLIQAVRADKLATKSPAYDVVVYGGTSGGIVAAVQAAKMKKSVVLIEPSKHLRGLTCGGLGATDIGDNSAVQDVAYPKRLERLLADGQVLAWTGPKRSISGIDPLELPGLVIDNVDATLTGNYDVRIAYTPNPTERPT